MPKIIKRESLLEQLESVSAGIADREVLEQSSCFVFQDGEVFTFNDQIACRVKCDVGIKTAAVRARPLLSLLSKMTEEELEIEESNGVMRFMGKRKEVSLVAEQKVLLPVGVVEKPGKWLPLAESFIEAIELARPCAGSDDSQFRMTCVHLTPDFIEACDNVQMMRVKVETPVKSKSTIVMRDSIAHVARLGMSEMCETDSWIHFRNPKGLVLSCRRYVEDYPVLDSLAKVRGAPITLPKGLKKSAEKAAVLASETMGDVRILIELRPDKMRITGMGAAGTYRETRPVAYAGESIQFAIDPNLLMDISEKYTDAEISKEHIRVKGGKWIYVSCLADPDDKEKEKEAATEEKPHDND